MAQIIVRNLEEGLKAQLAMYAKQHGHSMEEEVRQIIRNSLSRRKSGFGTRVAKRFAKNGVEGDLQRIPAEPLRNPFGEWSMFILDTNIVSELIKIQPEPKVVEWLDHIDDELIWTTSITAYEIQYGIMQLPAGKKRKQLKSDFDDMLRIDYRNRIIAFDAAAAIAAGKIAGTLKASGTNISALDIQIAGIVTVKGATLVTRNTKDFQHSGVRSVNPWIC